MTSPESTVTNIGTWLDNLPECVIVVDEDSVWIDNTEFYYKTLNCSVWLLIITRSVKTIKTSYSVGEIYKIHSSGEYKTLEKI